MFDVDQKATYGHMTGDDYFTWLIDYGIDNNMADGDQRGHARRRCTIVLQA